jgi:hypothetical protein
LGAKTISNNNLAVPALVIPAIGYSEFAAESLDLPLLAKDFVKQLIKRALLY